MYKIYCEKYEMKTFWKCILLLSANPRLIYSAIRGIEINYVFVYYPFQWSSIHSVSSQKFYFTQNPFFHFHVPAISSTDKLFYI